MDETHSEIAKQFVLPERQSKLHSLLGSDFDRGHRLYPLTAPAQDVDCVCKSRELVGHVIVCSRCERLYHGKCVRVTKEDASRIETFFCKECRLKNPRLEIRYRRVKESEYGASPRRKASANHRKHTRSLSRSPSNSLSRRSSSASSSGSSSSSSSSSGHSSSASTGSSTSGENDGSDFNGYGNDDGVGRVRKKAKNRDRRKIPSKSVKKKNGHRQRSVSVSNENGNPSYDEPMTPPLPSRPRESRLSGSDVDYYYGIPDDKLSDSDGVRTPPLRFSQKSIKQHSGKKGRVPGKSPGRGSIRRRDSDSTDGDVSDVETDSYDDDPATRRRMREKRKRIVKKKKRKKKSGGSSSKQVAASKKQPEQEEPYGEDFRRQCYGPGCVYAARYRSKYCSDDCGLRLASCRIYRFLPGRAQEWKNTPCKADEKNRRELEDVREKLMKSAERIMQLEKKLREHMQLVERVRKLKPDPNAGSDSESSADLEGSFYCITCGMEVASRQAVKHLEKCYAKYESQMSFGSSSQTNIDGESMFCDVYCPSNGMYCKRLKVVCPEHYREPKGSENDVCGCPLVDGVFKPNGRYCLRLKRKCTRHYLWERLRRAEIDAMRVKEFLTRDELFEKETLVRVAMANRASVLALMLHSTYDHPYMEREQRKFQRQQESYYRQAAQAQARASYGYAADGVGREEGRTPSPLPR